MSSRRVRGSGGQSARRAARTNFVIDTAKYIERNIPNFDIMNLESLEIIEEKAEEVLQNIGVKFLDNPNALKLWKDAGADVSGELVKYQKVWLKNYVLLPQVEYCNMQGTLKDQLK